MVTFLSQLLAFAAIWAVSFSALLAYGAGHR